MRTTPAVHSRPNDGKQIRFTKTATARHAIGTLQQGHDLYILTFGQFSLIDALVAILEQTGPASVALSTWTAADAHLEKSAELMASAQITDFRMIVDRSFESRQPGYVHHMRQLFGPECIRAINTHAKFILIRNATWDIVVRTSMNLNNNPRLENIEISAHPGLDAHMQALVDEIFAEVAPLENRGTPLELAHLQETFPFAEVAADRIPTQSLKETATTHVIRRKS